MKTPASRYGPAVGAADLTAEVRLDVAITQRRSGEYSKTTAAASSRPDSGQQKRPARASQASRAAPRGSPLHTIRVPTQLIPVSRG